MKKTHKLYRATSKAWEHLLWNDAIQKRIELAILAKEYYRLKAFSVTDKPCKFRVMRIRYDHTVEAISFNRKILKGR